ncbi:nucleoside triphosphate pyrophosphohydrolase [Bartonella sp. LJL80]
MKPGRDITQLIEVMAALRDPETGCSWDIVQTFETIVPYTIEEVYEVVDAIQRGDRVDLCEELGDLLLQVVYYARMAEEEGSFDFGDVVLAITEKMIRRHPHVFGSEQQKKVGLVPGEWNRIKQQEKRDRLVRRMHAGLADDTQSGHLATVRTAQPTEKEAFSLQSRAAEVGFDWKTPEPIFEKLEEEISELKEAVLTGNKTHVEEELGDVYFTLINLARRLEIEPKDALARTNKKFRNRFTYIEEKLGSRGEKIEESSPEKLEDLWNEAKSET